MARIPSEVNKSATATTSRHAAKPPFRADLVVWMDGEFVPWHEATVHVMAHVLHYGSSVFEGIRCYKTKQGAAVFRLPEHVRRLFDSARIYRMKPEFGPEQVTAAILETISRNGFQQCYIRPLVYRGLGTAGVNPLNSPTNIAIVCWDWGHYLGDDSVDAGIEVCVSSWTRMAPNTLPALAKAGANYMNSQLIKMEAILNGFKEGIALDVHGLVSEGSGENIFVVRDRILRTPPLASAVLPGITRDAVMTLARAEGLTVARRTSRARRCTLPTKCSSPVPPPRSARCGASTGCRSVPASLVRSPAACRSSSPASCGARSRIGTGG